MERIGVVMKIPNITRHDKLTQIKHIVDEDNNSVCWVTSDGQAHYDIKMACLRQVELNNNDL